MSAAVKHTPGPWHVEGMYVCPVGYQSNPICGVSRYLGQPDENISANARLIAAAPDMLEALKEALELAKLAESLTGCRGDDDYVWGVQEKISAAIAKATGAA